MFDTLEWTVSRNKLDDMTPDELVNGAWQALKKAPVVVANVVATVSVGVAFEQAQAAHELGLREMGGWLLATYDLCQIEAMARDGLQQNLNGAAAGTLAAYRAEAASSS